MKLQPTDIIIRKTDGTETLWLSQRLVMEALWNATLKTKQGKEIGVNNRTLSADLGEQDYNATMSRTGAILNLILFLIERNHCRKSLEFYELNDKK